MSGLYAYTPYIWPPLAVAVIVAVVGFYSFHRRAKPGALPLAALCLFTALWAAGSVLELTAVDAPTRIFWSLFQAVWKLPGVTAAFCFVLEYADPGRWLNRRTVSLLSLPVLMALLLIATNDAHHLIFTGFTADPYPQPVRGIGQFVFTLYMLLLAGLQMLVLIWLAVRSPQHRWPVALLLLGLVGSRATFLFELTRASPLEPLDPSLLSAVVLFGLYALVLFRFHLFDLIPVARETGIEQMREGMVVLDMQRRIMDLNPAAEKMLGASLRQVRGQSIGALSLFSDLEARLGNSSTPQSHGDDARSEISIKTGDEAQYYTLYHTRLMGRRGVLLGYNVLLSDITEYKRAQAHLLEQQRVVATLQERERLARELHDGLGQMLAAAHLQASTAKRLFAQGANAQTNECLDRLAEMTLEMESDVREHLLGAKTVFSGDQPFFAALHQYVVRFSEQYDLRIELSVPREVEEQGFAQPVEVQLVRVIQEALSNIRKHARAHCARVSFAVVGSQARIVIADDGKGFDPDALAAQAKGFGLQAMRERAVAMGGSLQVISSLGQGTQVVVQVPLKV